MRETLDQPAAGLTIRRSGVRGPERRGRLTGTPERIVTAAERAAEDARITRALRAGAVRSKACPLCQARPLGPCQADPAGDHLARWLAAYRDGRITRSELAAVISGLIVLTERELVAA